MRRFLHAWWPVAAVVAFTTVLVLQIPRKALFFVPATDVPAEPFVSFIALDDKAYAQLVSRIRMTWQMRGRTPGSIADSRTDAFDFSNPLPPPSYLPLRSVAETPVPPPLAVPISSLRPPTLGRATPVSPAPAPLPDRDPALLALPDGLPETAPPADFSLTIPRSIK